jgi:hypothetical protein
MEHFYQQVPGFMNHRNRILLDIAIAEFPHQGTWVELGSWMGRSAAYCAVELITAGKIGAFYCTDTWAGGDGLEAPADAYQQFLQHTAPIRYYITAIQSDRSAAADAFDDKTVDFCYVDALHTYEGVMADLEAWWPKIRPGSRFAGDDYTKGWPGVVQAVGEFFGERNIRVSRSGRCWTVVKPLEAQ